jgi:hypothetical protein
VIALLRIPAVLPDIMARVDLAQETLRLNALYAAMSDDELLELMNDIEHLTDIARDALSAQIAGRGIKSRPPERTQNASALDLRGEAANPDGFEDLVLGGVTIGECETSDEAGLLSFVLGESAIRSAVRATRGKFDLTLPQVRVAPEDAERAIAVLANPIPDSVRRAYAEMNYDNASFADQRCPRCNSEDILLQPENPGYLNDWLCSSCGYNWQDPLPNNLQEEK